MGPCPITRPLKFFIAGLPAFVLAVPLNALLVEVAGLAKPLAYAMVLLLQVLANFLTCFYFVFRGESKKPMFRQFWQFACGIMGFRMLDWATYSAGTVWLGVPYLHMQLTNVALFMLAKFAYANWIMGSKPIAATAEAIDRT